MRRGMPRIQTSVELDSLYGERVGHPMNPEKVPIILPNLGTDQVVLSAWYVHPGETVYAGDRVAEVLIPGATVDIPAPIDGVLVERQAGVDQPVFPGSILGFLAPLPRDSEGPIEP